MPSDASDHIRRIKAKTLAVFKRENPTIPDTGRFASSGELITLLKIGNLEACNCCQPVCDIPVAFAFDAPIDQISDFFSLVSISLEQPITIPTPPIDYPADRYVVALIMPEICNATTYSTALSDSSGPIDALFYVLGTFPTQSLDFPTVIIGISYPSRDIQGNFEYIVTASNDCSSKSTEAEFGCFLKDAPVTMADGSTKLIQDVVVGDIVLGAFGEHNPVLALHRPLLGAGHIVNINNEHKTTSHHPHVSSDRKFYCVDTEIINKLTYNKTHTIILGDGTTEKRIMKGLSQGRIHKLTEGVVLQTTTGPKPVESIEVIKMSPLTQVYHLVVGGSHTFNVEGYAVVGWADETDFDYDAWLPKA